MELHPHFLLGAAEWPTPGRLVDDFDEAMLQIARVTASVVKENEAVSPIAMGTAVLLEGRGAVASVGKETFSAGKTSSQVAMVTMSAVDGDEAALLVAMETDLLVDEREVVPSVAKSTALIDDVEESL